MHDRSTAVLFFDPKGGAWNLVTSHGGHFAFDLKRFSFWVSIMVSTSFPSLCLRTFQMNKKKIDCMFLCVIFQNFQGLLVFPADPTGNCGE
jgi:hypothetical protein